MHASTKTATVSLWSPVASTIASFYASSSQFISFKDPFQRREIIFDLHFRSEFLKKTSCHEKCQKTTTQPDCLLVRFMALGPSSVPRLMRITVLRYMTVKVFILLIHSLITYKLSWMKEQERNYLMLTLSS